MWLKFQSLKFFDTGKFLMLPVSVECDDEGTCRVPRTDGMLLSHALWLLVAQRTGLASQVHEDSQPANTRNILKYTKIHAKVY